MKKSLLITLIILGLSYAYIANAAPTLRYDVSILPISNNIYELGTTTLKWFRSWTSYASTTQLSADSLCLNSDTCRTTWPTGGSGTFSWTPTSWGVSTSTTLGFLQGFLSTASSTIDSTLRLTGNLFFDGELLPDGATCSNGQILKRTGANDWDCAADDTSAGGGTFAWTPTSYGVSTSTTLGFLQGFLSTASSTINASSTITGVLTASGGIFGNLTGTASLATALGANGANCSSGNSPLGVDASGAVESCFDVWTEAENTSAGYTSNTGTLTNIATTFPILGGPITTTGTLTFGGLSTSSPLAAGAAVLYATGVNTLASVATTTLTASSPLSLSNTVWKVGGSNSVLTLDTSGAWSGTAGSLAANGANCSAGNYPLGVDALGAVENCTAAGAGTVTSIATTWPITGGTITTTGTLGFNGLSTSTAITIGQMPYWTGVNTFGSVATGTISVPTGLTITANRSAVGGSATIGLDTGYVIPLQSTLDAKALGATTLTIAGTAGQITSSAGAQDISANRAWTLSLPDHVIFPNTFQATRSTTTHATSTNLDITSLLTFNGVTGDGWTDFCTTITGGAGLCDGDDASGAGGGFAWTPTTYGVSTSTTLGFLQGFLSTASSTIDSNLRITGNATATNATTTQFHISSILNFGGDVFDELVGTGLTISGGDLQTTLGTAIDISSETNLAGDTEIVLTGDALSLASTIARDTELPVGANPTGTIGLTAVNGVATTFLRSDGAPALSQSITPTWTGAHIFNNITRSTTTSATTTNLFSTTASSTTLSVGTTFNFLGTVITNVATWFSGLFDSNLATKTLADITGCTDCLNATDIEDIYLLDDGDVGTGVYDFGGATSFEIPNGTGPTLNAIGQLAWDITSGNLAVSTSTTGHVVIGGATTTLYAFAVASTSPDFISGGTIELPAHFLAQTAIAVICEADAGTSVAINISDSAATADSNAVTCTTTSTQFQFTSNNSYAAYAAPRLEFGTVTGSVDRLSIRIIGYRTSN